MAETLFSESWHLVAGQKIRLRPNVDLRRQIFRGETWYLIGDPYKNQYFRFRPVAYQFIARLDGKKTVEEIWLQCLRSDPHQTPGQVDIIQALAQLHAANLIISDLPPDAQAMFSRVQKHKQQTFFNFFLNFLFIRIPLWDPDRFLNRIRPVIFFVLNRFGFLAWMGFLLYGLYHAGSNWPDLMKQSEGVLAPGNIPWLYVTWGVVKFLHELGHAAMTKRFGGEVHNLGIMFLVFTPVPYVDATAAWGFRERYKRILVGAAGMMVELVISGIALLVWSQVGPGTVHQIAFNIIFLTSVTTLLFNLNPLMRFDGYYILSDLLDAPNLQQRAFQQLRYLAEKHLFGLRQSLPVTDDPRAATWLSIYGISCGIYRVLLLWGIILFIGEQLFGLGLVLAVFGLIMWMIVPLVKMSLYLINDTRLLRVRARACMVSFGGIGAILLFCSCFPWPAHFRAPGVIKAQNASLFINHIDGVLKHLQAQPDGWVQAGQTLLVLDNPKLFLERRRLEASKSEIENRIRWAQIENPAYIQPLQALLETVQGNLARLDQLIEALQVRAANDGLWFAPYLKEYLEAYVPRGGYLGEVVDPRTFYFSAIVSQQEASFLFSQQILGAEIKIKGEAHRTIPVERWEIVAADQTRLPTAALGWRAGGNIEVDTQEEEGTAAVEPFFEVRLHFSQPAPVALYQLRSGKARFQLEPKPLLLQWWRSLRLLLQKRYQL